MQLLYKVVDNILYVKRPAPGAAELLTWVVEGQVIQITLPEGPSLYNPVRLC